MPATNMTGVRKWRFTVGLDIVGLEKTDFWVEYKADAQDSGAKLGVALREVWERTDESVLQGQPRRVYMEDRLKFIKHTFVGKTGTLEVDYGTAYAKTFTSIKLVGVNVPLEQFNDLMEYELEFEFPFGSGGGGLEIARNIQFGTKIVTALNFIVEHGRDDRTVFKDLFRAAPVRIENGPPIQKIRIIALKDNVGGLTDLAKRQAVEAEIKDWLDNWLGEEDTLTIDASSHGTCHLRAVSPSDLTLPDALVYELEFFKGYSS